MEALLYRSMKEKTPIEMIYISQNETFTKRKVLVKTIHHKYVYAYCFLRKEYRRFHLDNILSVMPIRRSS